MIVSKGKPVANNPLPQIPFRLQIGCGRRRMDGWYNIDGDPDVKPDMVVNVTGGLPFPDESVSLIYSEDFIEHLSLEQAQALFAECHRVLQKKGWMRVLTPDLSVVCEHYFQRNPLTMLWYRKNLNSRTAAEMVNTAMRMGGHTFLYDEETLSLILREASFGVRPTEFNKSSLPELSGLDLRGSGFSIYLDCWKMPLGEIELPAWNGPAVHRLWKAWEDMEPGRLEGDVLEIRSRGFDPQLLGPVVSIPHNKILWCVIEMAVEAEEAEDNIQLFWRGDGEPFSIQRVSGVHVKCDGKMRSTGLKIPKPHSSTTIAQLRIDPLGSPGKISIKSISVCEAPPGS